VKLVGEFNIVVTGVGGQGVLTLSRVIAVWALKSGYKVRVGETLGMAQRGGIVQSYVRLGSDVESPLIEVGGADVLIALDYIEALRALGFLSGKSKVIVNSRTITPISVLLGVERMPSFIEALGALRSSAGEVYVFDASSIATKVGLPASINMAMLGAFTSLFRDLVDRELMLDAIREVIAGRFMEQNLKAFELGFKAIESSKNAFAN